MATIIKFKADGIKDDMLVPSMDFEVKSDVDVTNPTQEIDFKPVKVSAFSFSIISPTTETSQKLLEWITNHETKGQAKFSISKQAMTDSAREIILKDVCLTSYAESIKEESSTIKLSVIGRKVGVGDVEIDQSQSR